MMVCSDSTTIDMTGQREWGSPCRWRDRSWRCTFQFIEQGSSPLKERLRVEVKLRHVLRLLPQPLTPNSNIDYNSYLELLHVVAGLPTSC